MSVDSAAWQAGLRRNYLVTHINNEQIDGLPQPQIVRLIQKNSHMVSFISYVMPYCRYHRYTVLAEELLPSFSG